MTNTIFLDVDLISEELYQLLLEEFYRQNPKIENNILDNWIISAEIQK